MTGSHDALYRAICAHPDEDTPRLAFADLIEEEGDCLRAAFIRAQIALARVASYDPVHIAARQSDPGAFTGHGMAHTLPRLPDGYGWLAIEFRRGFPWKVGVTAAEAFDPDGSIFEVAPIQALDARARGRHHIDALAEWPHLARIHRLELSTAHFGPDDAKRLGNSPHVAKLTELTFEFDGITAEGLATLARSPLFPRLAALDLRSNVIAPALLVDALAAAREPGALARLSLAANRIDGIDAEHLFALPVLRDLEHLDLADNPKLGVAGITALAESGILRGLRVLDLEKTLPGVPGVTALAETSALASVRSLNLAANRLGPTAVKVIAQSASARGLRALNLSDNPIGDAGVAALADSGALAGLLDLDLADTGITNIGAMALADSPCLGNLLRLNLSTNSMRSRPFATTACGALTLRFGNRVSL